MDSVVSLNNSKLGYNGDRIYHIELEMINTIDKARVASYLELYIADERKGRSRTKLNKIYDFNFLIVNFQNKDSELL
jgi:hypothetical protein